MAAGSVGQCLDRLGIPPGWRHPRFHSLIVLGKKEFLYSESGGCWLVEKLLTSGAPAIGSYNKLPLSVSTKPRWFL